MSIATVDLSCAIRFDAFMAGAKPLPVRGRVLALDARPVDRCGRRRSRATFPEFRKGKSPGNAGKSYPADPPTDAEFDAILEHCTRARTRHVCSHFAAGRCFPNCSAFLWVGSAEGRANGGHMHVYTHLCEACGAEFDRKPRADRPTPRFCSTSCAARQMHKSRPPRKRTPWQERFPKYVPADVTADECWEWQGSRDARGYGRLNLCDGTNSLIKAHRASYEFHVGPIPHGLVICHRCDNPPCVNPAHLYAGTMKDNTRDMYERGREGLDPQAAVSIPDEVVVGIREAYAAGEPVTEIAATFGVCSGYVSDVGTGKTRARAGGPISPRRYAPRPRRAA